MAQLVKRIAACLVAGSIIVAAGAAEKDEADSPKHPIVKGATPSATFADDYLLRVETTGFVDEPVAETKPKETVLRAVEVVVRPDLPFYGKLEMGKRTLLLVGKLRATEDGTFDVHLRYVDTLDMGETISTKSGKPRRVLKTSACESNVSVPLGKRVILGGLETRLGAFDPKRKDTQTKMYHVLVLDKYTQPASPRR